MSSSSIFLISLPYLERAKFWLYKDQIKKKDKSTLQLEWLWHWFGGTKALHKESQKSHFYTIAFAVFTFQDFLLSFLVWIQKSVFETVLIDLKKIHCLSLKDLWETKVVNGRQGHWNVKKATLYCFL